MSFADRRDAGRRLAARLKFLRGEDAVVLALPRGGVPVAFEVAQALGAPLDVIMVRKLGVPFQPELAMGAIGEGGVLVVNDEMPRVAGVTPQELVEVERRERTELDRQARRYRGDQARAQLEGRTAVIVDDGVATGSTALAACQVAKAQGAARVVLAVPVAPPSTLAELSRQAEVVCVEAPRHLWAVGQWYRDFAQTSDDEVARLLHESALRPPVSVAADPRAGHPPVDACEVEVVVAHARLAGLLSVPQAPAGMVVFVHGSGSSRHSPRNRFVAEVLNRARLGTLLFDLLTPDEELDRANVFDIELLAGRLAEVTGWLRDQASLGRLPLGYFGASTGAGAALWAAADPDADIAAVVSRGGRPDLAGPRLGQVRAPTLLIVGGQDQTVFKLNREAQARLRCENRLEVVPDATHLFEEPGALAAVAELARGWLYAHLAAATPPTATSLPAGHRLVPHTADRIIEAWGPDRAACVTEALSGLVEGFAAVGDAIPTQLVPIGAGPCAVEDELVALFEQVIFSVDVSSVVPVRFHLGETEEGAIAGDMEVVPADAAALIGPVPKGVSYHELSMVETEGGWQCRVLVDV